MTAPPSQTTPSDPSALVLAAESYAARTFRYRDDVTFLLERCRELDQQQMFDDLVFNAKFITNAFQILKRVGVDTTDTAKLSAELGQMLEKTTTLLRTIVKEVPQERRAQFLETFLAVSPEAMTELMILLSELAWVKNYLLDQSRAR